MSFKVNAANVLNKVLNPVLHKRATAMALNELAEIARNRTRSYILDEYNFRRDQVAIKLNRADNSEMPIAELVASRKRPSFMDFGAIQTGRGVSAMIRKGRTTNRRRAFIKPPHKQPGNVMAFQRKTAKRYPLRKLTGPSVGIIMRSRPSLQAINGIMRQRGAAVYDKKLKELQIKI